MALALAVQSTPPSAVTLHCRQVNQAERWQTADMERDGRSFKAMIPAAYTQSPFALQYYFELRQGPTASLYPGFDEVFANPPYFVLAKG